MAELDSRIYGELQIPQIRTMEQREAAQAARDTAELNRDIARQKQSEIARASQANAALRQAMARFPNDPQKSMTWLTENGYGDVAMEMTEAIGKAGKAAEDSREQKLKADKAQWEQIYAVTRLMGNPESYGMGRSMILATDPQLAQFLPESWEQGGQDALKPFDTFLLSTKDKIDAETTRRGQTMQAETAKAGQVNTAEIAGANRLNQADIAGANRENQASIAAANRENQAAIASANRANQAAIASANRAVKQGGAAGDDGSHGLAEMVASSPSVLQGLTPTVAGQVMKLVAADPELRKKYQDSRLAPLREQSRDILSAVDKLVTTKDGKDTLTSGAQSIFGEYTPVWSRGWIPGQEATDANAALQQVMGQQIVDLIANMKSQSRTGATGFGQLSIRELDVLQSAATQLTHRLSQPAALQQLTAIKSGLNKILKDEDGTTTIKEETIAKTLDGAVKIGGFTVREKVAP